MRTFSAPPTRQTGQPRGAAVRTRRRCRRQARRPTRRLVVPRAEPDLGPSQVDRRNLGDRNARPTRRGVSSRREPTCNGNLCTEPVHEKSSATNMTTSRGVVALLLKLVVEGHDGQNPKSAGAVSKVVMVRRGARGPTRTTAPLWPRPRASCTWPNFSRRGQCRGPHAGRCDEHVAPGGARSGNKTRSGTRAGA